MAYYHGSIKLNRWEQFELNGDKKKANKPIVPPKQDYGAGIAAQFGLVKKPAAPKPGSARPAVGPRDGNQAKRRKSLSEDDGTSRSTEKRKEKAVDRPSESRTHMKEKSSTAKKAVPREINLGGFLGGSCSNQEPDERRSKEGSKLKKKSARAEQHGSISSPNDESPDSGNEARVQKRPAALDKKRERERLHIERQKRVDEERARLKALKRRNSEAQQEEAEKLDELERRRRKKEKEREKEKMRLKEKEREKKKRREINYDSDEDEDDDEVDEEDEDEEEDESADERLKKGKRKSRGSFNVEAWSRPLRGNYEESEDEEEEEEEEEHDIEEEEEEETDRRKKHKGKQLQEDIQRDRKRKRDAQRGRDEKHNSDSSDNELHFSERRRKSHDDDTEERNRDTLIAEKWKKKQGIATEKGGQKEKNPTPNLNKESQASAKKKTFTIPKVGSSKETPSDAGTQKIKSTSMEKIMKTDKNSQVKNEPESPTVASISMSNQISQKSTSLRNTGRLKPSLISSHVINVDAVSNLSIESPSKGVSLPKSSIIQEKEKRISSATIEIKSEPDDDEYTSPHASTKNASNRQSNKSGDTTRQSATSPFTSPDEKSASSLIEKYAAEQVPKEEPPVKVKLDANTCITRDTSRTLCCAKGNNLKDWVRSVVSRLGKKSTRMDSSSLNYFITLHSRFKVLTETNEMGDLEVLPEKDGNGDGKEPIRIFTNMWKENYQQYLDESLLNSIPEIIITRLYVSGSGGGGGGGGGAGSSQ